MFDQVSLNSTLQDASSEILLLLIGAFLFGLLMGWLMWGYKEKVAPVLKKPVIELPPSTPSLPAQPVQNVPIEMPAAPTKKTLLPKPERRDDLKIIEGIGPKVEQLLYQNNILTWKNLSALSIYDLKDILAAAGDDYALHDPSDWPEQARLASSDLWDELMQMQTRLRAKT